MQIMQQILRNKLTKIWHSQYQGKGFGRIGGKGGGGSSVKIGR